jgi:hypothetical protein
LFSVESLFLLDDSFFELAYEFLVFATYVHCGGLHVDEHLVSA